MVTRRTRVLSAIAVVLMLVSMFTCFVLPAVAAADDYEMPEAPANLKPYKERTTSDTATDYAITDAADWIAAAKDSNKRKGTPVGNAYLTFEGITLWFTNDIDFGGQTRVLKQNSTNEVFDKRDLLFNYYASGTAGSRFKGTIQGQGYSIKGLVIDLTIEWETNGNKARNGLICTGEGALIRDLTVDSSCSFKYDCSGYNTGDKKVMEFFCGVFMGASAGANTFINCRNEASLEYSDSTVGNPYNTGSYGKSTSSISAFGRQSSGLVMINCSNYGTIKNNDAGRAIGLAEWISYGKNNTILNSFNAGELIKTSTNDFYDGALSKSGTAQGAGVVTTVENCYAVGTRFGASSTEANSTVLNNAGESLDSDAAATGELAYRLNANHAGDYGRIYYTVDSEETMAGTAQNATVKVELDFYGTKYTTYINAGESVDLSELHSEDVAGYELADTAYATLQDGILNVTAAPADFEINVEMISNEVQLDALKAAVAVRKADGAENYTYTGDTYTGTLTELLAAIETKIADFESDPKGANAYVNNSQVLSDLAVLEAFVLSDVISINLYEKYPDHAGFSVASKADMEYLATVHTNMLAGQTIYITANIDMEGSAESLNNCLLENTGININGGNHTISNMWLSGAWLNDYAGSYVKDLTFKNCGYVTTAGTQAFLIESVGKEITLSNITFDNVTGTVTVLDKGIQGLMVGEISGTSAKLILRDITIVNSTMNRSTTANYMNSGLVLGKTYAGVLDVDGIYLNNNTLTGKNHTSGTGIVFGEIICNATIKNVGVFNTTVEENALYGVLTSMAKWGSNGSAKIEDVTYYTPRVKDPVITFENIIVMGNSNKALIRTDKSYPITVKLTNAYADVEKIFSTEYEGGYVQNYYDGTKGYVSTTPYEGTVATNASVGAEAAIKNGEAAGKLNAADVEKLWAMDGKLPIFASATAKAAVAVTFKALDAKLKDAEAPVATYTLYTDKNGKLIDLTQEILDAASWDNEAGLADAIFNAEATVIGYTTPAHDHQFSYSDNGDGNHTATCTFSHTDDQLGTFSCGYTEVQAHEIDKKNATDVNTEEAGAHSVVDACKYCDFESDTYTDCEGTLSINDEESWVASCAGAGQTTTVCSACDYKHVKVHAQLSHAWGGWTHVEGTDTHKRTCANVANCNVPDEVEDCKFENWAETTPPTVAGPGEETGYCTCGNTDTKGIPALTGVLLNPGEAVVGNVLEVEVNIQNNDKIVAGVELAITYNADLLTLQGAKNGKWDVVFDDRFPAASGVTTTKFNVISNAGMDGDGAVVVLQFAVVNDEAYAGALTDLKVAVTEAYDMDFNLVRFAEANASIEIETALIKGDIDGNRFVNMADAILLLRYYTEKPQGATEWTVNNLTITDKIADITAEGDGADLGEGQIAPEVNINDVLHLLRYLNGWYTDAEFFGE